MKTTIKTLITGIVLCALTIASCEKPQTESELPNDDGHNENFKSKTGNHDSKIDGNTTVLSPLLHKRYDAALNKEEVEALFNAEVMKFKETYQIADKSSSFLYFRVATKTGSLPHSESNANIWARVNFLTNNGEHQVPWFKLDHISENEFENGGWDVFYLRVHIPSSDWIEAKSAVAALQGTDGWYIRWFDVHLYPDNRYFGASGSSHIFSNPEMWLDNTTWEGWDYYNTGVIGTGRLIF